MRSNGQIQSGFTLVEMIMVIVITGIIGGIVAIFLKAPIQQYTDVARRADMTDIADTALRRMGRDIRTAVPNSIRTVNCPAAASSCMEFLPTKAGGRYRANAGAGTLCAAVAGNADGDALSFVSADTCFEVIGAAITFVRGVTDDTSDQIVVGSTQSDGNPPYDKTFAGNGVRRPYTGATGTLTKVQILGEQFPAFAELPGQRFLVVPGGQQAVTYSCEGVGVGANGDGTGVLRRYSGYGFGNPSAATGGAALADKLAVCDIGYDAVNQRNGLVDVRLGITRSNESVSLYHVIHVNNVP